MADFSGMINAAGAQWGIAQAALKAIEGLTAEQKKEGVELPKLLLNAQMEMGVATTMEQKASSAIDKAYQAHGQVASK